MDKSKLELLNVSTDLLRAIDHYLNIQNPRYDNCQFLQNIVKNFPQLVKLDPNIKKYINLKSLQADSDPPRVKAEDLLLASVRLQSYIIHHV